MSFLTNRSVILYFFYGKLCVDKNFVEKVEKVFINRIKINYFYFFIKRK